MNLKTTRRRMLALSAALPALNFLRSIDAQAMAVDGENVAKRFLVLYHPFGSSAKHWYGDATPENFKLGYTLNPMEQVKDNIVLCKNVDNKMGCDYWNQAPKECRARGLNETDQHTSGTNICLSPYRPADFFKLGSKTFSWPGGESLDWVMGKKMKAKYKTPHDVLYFSPANSGGKDHANIISTRKNAGGQLEYKTPETNPVEIYKKYLSGVTAQGGNTQPTLPDADQRRKLLRGLVTDFAAKEVLQYQKALPAEFKGTLDAHLGELRDLEKKLTEVDPNANPNTASICSVINPPDASLAKVEVAKGGNVGNFRARSEIMADLCVSALSCGITPVTTMSWWTFHGNCSPVNVEGTKAYGDLHLGLQHNRNGYKPQDTADCHRHVALQTARIIEKMKAIPEGNGTMLDNTLILWTSCLGMDPFDGPIHHNKFNVPFMLAGGAGGALKTGRMIDFKRMNHVRLLDSVTHLLGFPDAEITDDTHYTKEGPAKELLI